MQPAHINFDFFIREDKELVYIKSDDEKLSKSLNRNETLCLLVLRILYQRKLDEVTLSDEIEITTKELQDQLFAIGFEGTANDRVKKSVLNELLRVFKQHNIIYYSEKDINLDSSWITIYPSIEVAMDFKDLSEIVSRLDSLKGGDDIYE